MCDFNFVLQLPSDIESSDLFEHIQIRFNMLFLIQSDPNIFGSDLIRFKFGLHSDDFFINLNNLQSDQIDPNPIRIRFCAPLVQIVTINQ